MAVAVDFPRPPRARETRQAPGRADQAGEREKRGRCFLLELLGWNEL